MSRKLLTLVLSSLLVVSFGLKASAQPADVKVELTSGPPVFTDVINGLDGMLGHNQTYGFTVQAKVSQPEDGGTIGFTIYSPDGSISTLGVSNATMSADWSSATLWWTLGGGLLSQDIDGTLPEALLTGGAKLLGAGFTPTSFVDVLFFDINVGSDSGVFCIDSAFFPPSGDWLFTSSAAAPNLTAGGGDGNVGGASVSALCYTTFTIPDLPPTVVACATPESVNHCDALNGDVDMVDPDPENQPITYSGSTSGTGTLTVDAGTGAYQYVPGAGENGAITITVNGAEPDGPNSDCVIDVTVTNNAPALTCPPNVATAKGKSATSPGASVADADGCDGAVYSLVSVTPIPTGTVSVDPSTGAVTFASAISDALAGADTDYSIVISVTDGIDSDECTMTFTVLNTEAFCVSIGQTDKAPHMDAPLGTLQGHQVDVCLNFDAGSNEVGGFDFLIQYDNSALSFVGASEGNIFADYEWEYFTYRFGPNGNCTGGCPSGKLRVIGIAEQNDGMHHPTSTKLVPGDQFACLTFLVSNDRNLECQFVPIRWCWVDCGDNSLSSSGGDTLYTSRFVFDYIGTGAAGPNFDRSDITGGDPSFPTLTGSPDVCLVSTDKGAPEAFVDFKNGGVRIICAEDIDARGDINLNGLSNEIADAVMFTEYFVSGLAAFGTHVEGSIAASEVNGDGIPVTVADLVYLIRVIVGDALPLPKLASASAITIATNGNMISADAEMGAALFVFDGIASDVNLIATNMEIKSGVVNGNTHVLVYSMEKDVSIAAGNVISVTGTLVSVEAADYNGVALSPSLEIAKPTSFAVHQNYPNPFNPNTKISFDLTDAAKYSVRIYNVAGQLVREITGEGEAGTVELDVDFSNSASGVYFYKVSAAGFSATKKMVLLK